jgi:CrcB protein
VSDANAALPLDSDVEVGETPSGRPRPVHLSWPNIGLVAAGGAVGTSLRYVTTLLVPSWAGVPVATLGINVLGAFLLGALLELLADRSIDAGVSRRLRLTLGTGVLGGFTTYSALSTDTASLALAHPVQALGYAAATVVVGAGASALGIWLARSHLRSALADRSDAP